MRAKHVPFTAHIELDLLQPIEILDHIGPLELPASALKAKLQFVA